MAQEQALEQDPGYQFRLDQGLKSLENSAAGRGLLRTGGTLKGIQDFGQQSASQEYQNAFGRARDTYGLNQAVRQSEQGQQFGQSLSATQQNQAQDLAQFNAKLASQGQTFPQAATQNTMNEGQTLAAYNANLTGQNQGFQQALAGSTLNSQNENAAADRDLTAQQQTQGHRLAPNRRHGGDSDVDLLPLDSNIDSAVLRQALVGDVHPGHHLDA
jgi:hypothetical protein